MRTAMQDNQPIHANDNYPTSHRDQVCISIEDASKLLGIGLTKFYEELNSKRIKAKRFGRRTLVSPDSLKIWFDNLPDFKID